MVCLVPSFVFLSVEQRCSILAFGCRIWYRVAHGDSEHFRLIVLIGGDIVGIDLHVFGSKVVSKLHLVCLEARNFVVPSKQRLYVVFLSM